MSNVSVGALVFETALGFVGIAWGEKGLTRLCLFQSEREQVERRLQKLDLAVDAQQEMPDWVVALVRNVKTYAIGEEVDFTSVPVDLAGIDDFRLAIYDAARRLQFGETTTYGELAKRAGQGGLPRETGQALGANPVPLVIPCHRVLAAGGKIGGFSAPGGSTTKAKMLALEGVTVGPEPGPQRSFAF